MTVGWVINGHIHPSSYIHTSCDRSLTLGISLMFQLHLLQIGLSNPISIIIWDAFGQLDHQTEWLFMETNYANRASLSESSKCMIYLRKHHLLEKKEGKNKKKNSTRRQSSATYVPSWCNQTFVYYSKCLSAAALLRLKCSALLRLKHS